MLAMALLTSCIQNTKHEGIVFEEGTIEKLQVDLSKNEVVSILGSPSFVLNNIKGTPETWVYVSSDKTWVAFFKEKVKTQKIVEIEFKADVVSKIKQYNENDIPKQSETFFDDLKDYKKP